MRLSDYRGKVVVVVFWASWCVPCREQIPHERDLAKRLEGKAFALLGVDIDHDKSAGKATISQERITWPNWYDPPGEEFFGPIATRYGIMGVPMVYVLDGKGIIRAKDVRGEALSRSVDAQLAAHTSFR